MSDDSIDRFRRRLRARRGVASRRAHAVARAPAPRSALERFAESGLPTHARRGHGNTRASRRIAKRPYAVSLDSADSGDAGAPLRRMRSTAPPVHLLVFVNGRHAPALSHLGTLPAGATLGSLGDALDRDAGSARALPRATCAITRRSPRSTRRSWPTAFTCIWRAGRRLPSRCTRSSFRRPTARPSIRAMSSSPKTARRPRSSSITPEATTPAYFTNAVTQIFAHADAAVAHYKLQQDASRGTAHRGHSRVAAARQAGCESHSIALGAALARNDITTSFDAEGCEATLNGLYLAGGRQHVDHHTRIDHAQPHGTSREYYKGVLDGGSRGVFNGKVIVHPGAQRTDAQLSNHNLLLSAMAEVDTKPAARDRRRRRQVHARRHRRAARRRADVLPALARHRRADGAHAAHLRIRP